MNSKSMIRIWQKNFRIETGSLTNVTDRLRNCGHNWKPNNWLMEVVPGATGMLQNGIMTGKQWIDSKIASQMNWSIDMYHDQGQMSKMDNLKIKESIKKLHELREKLDKVCVGANYGKAAGNSAEILGACGVITGFVMSLYELPSGPNITKIGNLVHYGGTFVDNSSKVIESCFSKKYLKEVLAVLKENKEISKAMGKWLEYTKELDARAIIRGSQKEVLSIILEICSEFCKLTSSGIGMNEDLNFMKQGKYITYIWSDVQIALSLVIIMKLYNNMCASPLLVDKIRSVLSVLNIKPENVKVLIQILIASCNFLEIYSSLDFESVSEVDLDAHHESDAEVDPETNLKVDLKADSEVDAKYDPDVKPEHDPEINTECTRKLPFRAMSLAYSFNSLIDAASNIRRGESQYSDALKGIIKTLERELKFIKKV